MRWCLGPRSQLTSQLRGSALDDCHRRDLVERHSRSPDHRGDGHDVVEMDRRQIGFNRHVADYADNAGIAIAALRAAGLGVPDRAIAAGIRLAEWPARLQRLQGHLAAILPNEWELWLDGGHNPGAAAALADHLRHWQDRPVHLLVGMKRSKDSAGFLAQLIPYATTLWAVAEPGQHEAMQVAAIITASGGIARPGGTVVHALDAIPRQGPPARVLICGSLYLAGEVLKQDRP